MKQTSQYQAMKQEGILLNANESSVNLPAAIRKEIAEAITRISFHRYPLCVKPMPAIFSFSRNRSSLETAQMRCSG